MKNKHLAGVGVKAGLALLLAGGLASLGAGELGTPLRIEAKGKPIDMEAGCASPFVMDFDGDGLKDLLVGQRGECKLCIYRNQGTSTSPKLGPSAWFKAGGEVATLPGG
jgi:hypothetical protein